MTIETFRPEHAAAFDALNRAWLVGHDLIEPADEPSLRDPEGQIIRRGGQVFVALEGTTVIGTCAIVPYGDGVFELVKLAVAPSARGQGIGRELVDRCLAFAQDSGASQVVLLSSSRLGNALRLYERVGFRHATMPAWNPYRTADVYMVLDLQCGESAA